MVGPGGVTVRVMVGDGRVGQGVEVGLRVAVGAGMVSVGGGMVLVGGTGVAVSVGVGAA
jgi:hypothetical protein